MTTTPFVPAGNRPIRALGLLSGGLDSTLAVRLLQEQGIEVGCVNFHTGFCIQSHTGAMRNPREGAPPPRHDALHAAQTLGVKLHLIDIASDYVRIVTHPKHGYGKNLNPCLDCKIFMVAKAWAMAKELGYDFIFSGEVLGQRPMSQRRDTFPVIDREAGVAGWLLRPLTALRMPETEPEKRGWVDRTRLEGFSGRGRKPQMALAKKFAINDYPSPAGGCCFLTDENYARKLRDLWAFRQQREYSMEDILLLKAGRHIRPAPHFKLIVGRDQTENRFLSGFRKGRVVIQTRNIAGPLTLMEGEVSSREDRLLACRIAARYSKGKESSKVAMSVEYEGVTEVMEVFPLPAHELPDQWHV
ncbi:MAG: tRNA (5-methylaminomethyl-2-thiouridylate)-methyltransferase [Magnetococcales bacterium]|nr:tRNA (5-methylaminomethyl-2-thiouridylate)-methyltransferase [Magnetococcales bacterium]MBF0148504.1 tRNA (5-methylaminomethyl-2-thiouridylate)-methyltransferase [Magnetococcales bacterium]MBF0173932.1 tRNA (5-methylaminomethyl-2-thiouridylate)-methyltransferase [Magnetococcales bacterium]MBF0347414.1 tRNA (5-methylaminomethyl-2-thiouridylate)-methyltransferase [Magnetococcales bacterium]MBF0630650.1 tRNA (5-methylaminomethyl-2-thiouridylate)-methyltransferase [Magnetococcales bacterium]